MTDTPAQTPAPLLRIVRGNPTDEDVAALVTVLAGANSTGEPVDTGPRDGWGRLEERLRPAWNSPSSFTNLRW